MHYLHRTILFVVCLAVLSTLGAYAQERQQGSMCANQFVMPNADLDNYELPLTGKLKRTETKEIDLADKIPSDLIVTTNFDELGRISNSFLTSTKIKVFGKEVYTYDSKNRLMLVVSYNPDGSAVMEDVFAYDAAGNLKEKITRNAKTKVVIWNKEFSYPPGSEYSEFFDKRHNYGFRFKKDNRCRIIEIATFKLDRTLTGKIRVAYDDEKNTMVQSIYSPEGNLIDEKRAEFELDEKGNWIKNTRYELALEDGKPVFKPATIIERKITYSDAK